MKFDPMRPFCDGICFCDLWMVPREEDRNMLAARGLVYITEFFSPEGHLYGGDILAKDLEAAEEIAFARGLGETVIGPIASIGIWGQRPS